MKQDHKREGWNEKLRHFEHINARVPYQEGNIAVFSKNGKCYSSMVTFFKNYFPHLRKDFKADEVIELNEPMEVIGFGLHDFTLTPVVVIKNIRSNQIYLQDGYNSEGVKIYRDLDEYENRQKDELQEKYQSSKIIYFDFVAAGKAKK